MRDDRDSRVHPSSLRPYPFNLIPSSSSCFGSTGDGASLIRSCPRAVFGKAMTSRSDSARAISIAMRSKPRAMPPCDAEPKRAQDVPDRLLLAGDDQSHVTLACLKRVSQRVEGCIIQKLLDR